MVENLKDLQEPIHGIQEGETPRQYYFLDLFFSFDGSFEQFKKALEGKTKGSEFEGAKLEYNPYSVNTFDNLRTRHKWMDRKKSFQFDRILRNREIMQKIENKRVIKRYELKEENEFLALQNINENLKEHTMTGGQFKDYTQGVRNMQDSRSIDRGEPTEITDNKHTVEGDLASNVTVYEGSVSEDIILNPAYAELTRKLLEDITDD